MDTRVVTANVASGATISSVIMTSGFVRYGLELPAAFTGTAITFQVTSDLNGATGFQVLCSSATTAVTMTVAASRSYDLTDTLRAWQGFKIVTGTAQATAVALVVSMVSS